MLRTVGLDRLADLFARERDWRTAWAWAFVVVVALRLGLGLVMGSAWWTVRPYLPAGAGSLAEFGGGEYSRLQEAALAVWPRWDAVHYLTLARVGYAGVSAGDSVFYPLYPFAIRLLAPLAANDFVAASLVVSSLAAVAALAGLYRLTENHYGLEAARWAVITFAVYPTAFFLVAPFTEGLFLALTLGAFLAAEAQRWGWAGLLGALGGLTRGPALLNLGPLLWIAWTQWRARPHAPQTKLPQASMAAGLLAVVGGGLGFLGWRHFAGFAPMSDILLAYSGLELVDPVRGLYFALVQVLTVPDLPTVLEVLSALIFMGITVVLGAQPRWRNGAWLIYMIINLFVYLGKHSLVASSLQSLARYSLALFPAFVIVGDWLARQRAARRFVYLTLSSAGLLVLSVLYTLWFFIG